MFLGEQLWLEGQWGVGECNGCISFKCSLLLLTFPGLPTLTLKGKGATCKFLIVLQSQFTNLTEMF